MFVGRKLAIFPSFCRLLWPGFPCVEAVVVAGGGDLVQVCRSCDGVSMVTSPEKIGLIVDFSGLFGKSVCRIRKSRGQICQILQKKMCHSVDVLSQRDDLCT